MCIKSSLLALVVVLGFVRETDAEIHPPHNFTIEICEYSFGFQDRIFGLGLTTHVVDSQIHLGPLGEFQIPLTAKQGVIGFYVILATLIILPVTLTIRWKRKHATP